MNSGELTQKERLSNLRKIIEPRISLEIFVGQSPSVSICKKEESPSRPDNQSSTRSSSINSYTTSESTQYNFNSKLSTFSKTYKVLWSDKPFGLSLRPNSQGLATIIEIFADSFLYGDSSVSVGDQIIGINEVIVRNNFVETMKIIKSASHPVEFTLAKPTNICPTLTLVGILSPYYGVVWRENQILGVTLISGENNKGASIQQVDGDIYADNMGQGLPGDTLVKIDSIDVMDLDFNQIETLLGTIQKPILLIFHRKLAEKLHKKNMYQILYSGEKIGIVLISENVDGFIIPKIFKFDGFYSIPGFEQVAKGDHLLSIGEYSTKYLGFKRSISLMEAIRTPTILTFQRKSSNSEHRRESEQGNQSFG